MIPALALVALAYGCFVVESSCWFSLANGVFLLPALFWRMKRPGLTVGAFCLAVLIALPPALLNFNRPAYLSLPKNLNIRVARDQSVYGGVAPVHRLTTDAHGFRVVPPVDYSRKDALRIFTIGGSTTENIHLDDERTWPHRLQQSLSRRLGRKVEVINTGVSGLRADNHLATLGKIGALDPDLVIFLMGFNDWNHHIRETFSTPLRDLARLRHRLSPSVFLDALWLFVRSVVASRSATSAPIVDDGTYIASRQAALLRNPKYEWRPETVHPAYLPTLAQIGSLCRNLNVPCLFVDQSSAYGENTPQPLQSRFWMTPPHEHYTMSLDSMIHIARLYNRTLRDFVLAAKHPFCDLASKIPPLPQNFFDDCHFTDVGAEKVAEILSNCVEKIVR